MFLCPEATLPSIPFLQRPVFFHRTRFRASGGTLALLYRLKEGDCTQGTRKSVREISLRITCDILKPQYGFRQSHDIGMHDTTFLQTDTSTSIFICVLADTEYRYRYFLDLVSMKVQFIWRQILF